MEEKAIPIQVGSKNREQDIQNRIAFLLNFDKEKERNRHKEAMANNLIELLRLKVSLIDAKKMLGI